MKKILILGATSSIAEEYIKLNSDGNHLILIARDSERLEAISKDSINRGANSVECMSLELSNPQNINQFFNDNSSSISHIDTVLIASGTLPNQHDAENNTELLEGELSINAISPICFINELIRSNSLKEDAYLIAISSVAGDRGRQSNYIYGAAKSCLSTYLEGLWHKNKIEKSSLKVLDVKPGFVDTPMTKNFEKGLLWSKPAKIATLIDDATKKEKTGIIYTPLFWWFIMFIIKHIPSFIYKKIKL